MASALYASRIRLICDQRSSISSCHCLLKRSSSFAPTGTRASGPGCTSCSRRRCAAPGHVNEPSAVSPGAMRVRRVLRVMRRPSKVGDPGTDHSSPRSMPIVKWNWLRAMFGCPEHRRDASRSQSHGTEHGQEQPQANTSGTVQFEGVEGVEVLPRVAGLCEARCVDGGRWVQAIPGTAVQPCTWP
jgi:hypothetical protein